MRSDKICNLSKKLYEILLLPSFHSLIDKCTNNTLYGISKKQGLSSLDKKCLVKPVIDTDCLNGLKIDEIKFQNLLLQIDEVRNDLNNISTNIPTNMYIVISNDLVGYGNSSNLLERGIDIQ